MRQFVLANFAFVIPLLILFIKSWMKHTIGQKLSEINYYDFILDLPIDLLFISISMNITYLLKADLMQYPDNVKFAFFMLLVHFAAAIICVLLWRGAKVLFKEKERFVLSAVLGALNYVITVPMYSLIVQLLLV